jgi:hypothetical protein
MIYSTFHFVHFDKKIIWETIKPHNFKEEIVFIILYKDLYGFEYVKL